MSENAAAKISAADAVVVLLPLLPENIAVKISTTTTVAALLLLLDKYCCWKNAAAKIATVGADVLIIIGKSPSSVVSLVFLTPS